MLGRLIMKLKAPERITYQKSSLFQGVLMELIHTEYAEKLHQDGWKPYAQHVTYKEEILYWEICTLNKEAYEAIILPLLSSNLQEIVLKHNDLKLQIIGKEFKTSSYQECIEEYYLGTCSRYITLRFCTPTAFKQQGKYIFYPDLELIYNNLIHRHDSFSSTGELQTDSILEQLTENSEIIRYDLKSTAFQLEGVKIPAFMGKITIKLQGPQPFINIVHYLFRIGEYSGVGIKTAIGMGAMEIEEATMRGGKQKHDRT